MLVEVCYCEHCKEYINGFCNELGIFVKKDFFCGEGKERKNVEEVKKKLELIKLGVIDFDGTIKDKYKNILKIKEI